jgi:hypothetical protein
VDVPGSASARTLELEFAVTEDKKIRGLLKDANAVEAKVTALQVIIFSFYKHAIPTVCMSILYVLV